MKDNYFVKNYKYKIINIVLILLVYLLLDIANSDSIDSLFGPRSLLFICTNFRVSTNLEELCTLIGYSQGSGTTLLGIYQAACKKGLPAVPVKTDIDKLCRFKSPRPSMNTRPAKVSA